MPRAGSTGSARTNSRTGPGTTQLRRMPLATGNSYAAHEWLPSRRSSRCHLRWRVACSQLEEDLLQAEVGRSQLHQAEAAGDDGFRESLPNIGAYFTLYGERRKTAGASGRPSITIRLHAEHPWNGLERAG